MNLNHTIAILGFNNHKITLSAIKELRKSGSKDPILFYDNGSQPSFENLITDSNFTYHRKKENTYVNPAWNDIFNMVDSKYVTLLNNDCFIGSHGYFNEVIPHMENNNIVISSCKTKNIPFYNAFVRSIFNIKYSKLNKAPLKYSPDARRQGWLMTINLDIYKTLDYEIPSYLKVWYGDDWIWSQVILNNLNYAVYTNRYALHVKGSTSSTVSEIVEKDIEGIEKHGDWYRQVTGEMHSKKYV